MERIIPRKFTRWCERVFGEDLDQVDVKAHYDATLTVEENETFFREAFPIYFATRTMRRPTIDDLKALGRDEQDDALRSADTLDYLYGRTFKCLCIVGETGTGKTALSFSVAEELAGRKPIYVFRHPRPDLLEREGFKHLRALADIEQLHDCILLMDEPQLSIKTYDHHANEGLQKILSLCRQRDITLIISTSDTRFVTKGIEAYVEAWFITDLDYELVKRGSVVQKAVKQHTFLDPNGFRCVLGTALFYCRKHPELCGYKKYSLPDFWSDEWSKPYRYDSPKPAAKPIPKQTSKEGGVNFGLPQA